MVCKDTLRIKNLPNELSEAQKEDFLRHFGAVKVKILCSRAKEKSACYAKFDSPDVAKTVMLRLHQFQLLNNRLCVEYAEYDVLQGKMPLKKQEETPVSNKLNFRSLVMKLNAFNESVGFNQPPPSHLKYNYPKANRATINNIAHALGTIPRFYTQVLHLMNRMNLPPPFAMAEPPVPIRKPPPPTIQAKQPEKSDSESEMESDHEEKPKEVIPAKRTLPQKKMVKRPKFIKPNITAGKANSTNNTQDAGFEPSTLTSTRKIELKLPSEPPKPETTDSTANPQEEPKTTISPEELAANQIALKDLNVLPVFKNYHAGAPTCRLYIKNCAKNVTVEDLNYIYSRYKTEEGQQFDIKLLHEGRMKGQAFVTLDTVELAQKAVKETNGFVLKDKPLVVVFAKSAVPTKKPTN